MFQSFIFVSIFLGATVNAFSCPIGALPSPTNKPECYYFVTENVYFLEAEEICEKNGGNLVSIHNMLDNMFIAQEALKLFDKTLGPGWIQVHMIL
uniref:C-type lectin domain-containing protein n=1 Tax=Panagrolaimus superbus TaxID=310955 RepID=A0A914YSW0_9BILA